VIFIEATRGWGSLRLRELWEYRELLWFMVVRDIKGSYRQMALGPLWILIQPLVSMVIFSLIFGALAKLPSDGVPYPIFTYSALLPWNYFAIAADSSVGSLVNRMMLISKVYFPRLLVPITAVLAGLVDLAISFLVLLGMMFYYGYPLTWKILTVPLFVLLAAISALGVGLWGASLSVRFRDFRTAINYGIRLWMYITPVAYAASLIPEQWQTIYQLNPLYWVIEGFRWALLGSGEGPQPLMLIPVGFVILMLVTGAFVFKRTERTIVDLL
jgi:lipopolysaccharide transport system permease protein